MTILTMFQTVCSGDSRQPLLAGQSAVAAAAPSHTPRQSSLHRRRTRRLRQCSTGCYLYMYEHLSIFDSSPPIPAIPNGGHFEGQPKHVLDDETLDSF